MRKDFAKLALCVKSEIVVLWLGLDALVLCVKTSLNRLHALNLESLVLW